MITVPTLLVGLGGIGSRVVDTVYGMLPVEDRSLVAIHAFDTNINDISKLQNLGKDRVTQTSTGWTVEQYLHFAGGAVNEWFPHEYPEIRRKLLTEGAGQIRAVSRLAYRAAIEAGKLDKIKSQVVELLRQTDDGLSKSLRIMIVSSLAGGTGAGLFLQTAMYLADLLKNEYGKQNVLVRGAFLLPDILVKNKAFDDQDEIENVRCNAYACLKELNAVLKTSRSGSNSNVTIEFEYKPNQRALDGSNRSDLGLEPNAVPYEFAFMYDFENSTGGNIGAFDNYVNQIVRATYLQLFSPVSGDSYSKEDNKIAGCIRSEGLGRFCGSGVGSLVYPYADIVDYCALRWSTESLSAKWLKLDEQYEEELRKFQRDLNSGLLREKPEITDRYPWLLESIANGQKPDPFFKSAYRSAHVIGEKGNLGAAKHELFLSAIEAEIDRTCKIEAEKYEGQPSFMYDEGKLAMRDKAKNEIIAFEANLNELQEKVFKFVNDNSIFMVNRVALQDADEYGAMNGEDCRLNSWLLGRPEAMHPVAVRYFLYKLSSTLESRMQTLAARNVILEKNLRGYLLAYDLSDTEEVTESAEDRVRLALNQARLKSWFNNKFKEFIDEYQDKSGKQLKNLVEYRTSKLTEKVFTELKNLVEAMIDDWEHYFRNLKDTANSLKREQLLKVAKHDNTDDPTTVYVYASSKHKERLWDDLSLTLSGDTLPAAIAREIYLGQYLRFCKAQRGERVPKERSRKTEEMFRKDVVGWCRGELLKVDALNLNIVSAIEEEIRATEGEPDDLTERVSVKISSLANLARPLVPPASRSSSIRCWGMHPESSAQLFENQKNDIFANDLLEDEGFSRHELLYYIAIYGLRAEDFTKFSCGMGTVQQPGAYYLAYQKRKYDMTHEPERYVSPHLDKRWHLPAYMPDLNSDIVPIEERKINRAFLLGMVHGFLQEAVDDGRGTWVCYRAGGGSESVKVLGKKAVAQPHALHGALFYNPAIVDRVLGQVKEAWEGDRSSYPNPESLDRHAFRKGLSQYRVLQKIYSLPFGERSNDQLPDIVTQKLIPLLVDEVVEYFVASYGTHNRTVAKNAAADFIEQLKSEVPELCGVSQDRYTNTCQMFLANKVEQLKRIS